MRVVLERKIGPPFLVGIKQTNHFMGEWVRENFGENQEIVGSEDIDRGKRTARIECFQ